MRAQIEFSELAIRNIEDTHQYISEKLKNKDAADKLYFKIFEAIDSLVIFPQSGKIFERPNPYAMQYRFVPIGNYLLFYYLEEDIVHIDRLIYARSDYAHLLETP